MEGVFTIDCNYIQPNVACAYLIVDNGRAVFVENNTSHALSLLLQALETHDILPENVDYAIITHVHLDHAGGSGSLMQKCPNAKLLAHPKAARHVIDPSRLIASAKSVYGDEFDELYGDIIPVESSRVRIMEDGEILHWQNRFFQFIYTRGHANHHFCIYDSGSNGIFTGDSFGIAYPNLQKDQPFIFPTTTPTDFDPGEAIISLDKILDTGAERAYLTHFGSIENLSSFKIDLMEGIHILSEVAKQAIDLQEDDMLDYCRKGVKNYFLHKEKKMGVQFSEKEWELLQFDIDLNSQGLAYWAKKQKSKFN
ncbi:MAG: MBL fold metallo-hydrolase [Leptospira sp.]|nr:MBL fold metallo-hydrolase [Leptospira sp.]